MGAFYFGGSMKIKYKGDKPETETRGIFFPAGVGVEVNAEVFAKLSKNPEFEAVSAVKVEPLDEEDCPFPVDSKDSLEEWARGNLSLELDKRKSLAKLIKEVKAALEVDPDGDNE